MFRKALFAVCAGAMMTLAAVPQAMAAEDSGASVKRLSQPIPLSTERVAKNIGAQGVYLFDCNPDEIYEQSHIKGSIHLNVPEWQKLLPKDKENSFLIFYCINRMCSISFEMGLKAIEMGYRYVYQMPDGIQGWVTQGREFEGTGRIDRNLQDTIAAKKARGESLTK